MRKSTKKKEVKVIYQGTLDPAQFIHSNKTHRSVSEAFRDADYATAFYRHKSEWDDCKEFFGGMAWIMPAIVLFVYVCYLILKEI